MMKKKDKIQTVVKRYLRRYQQGELNEGDASQQITYRLLEYALDEGALVTWLAKHKVGAIDKYGGLYLIYDGSIQALMEQALGV